MLEEFTKGDTDQMWTAFKKSFDDEIKQTKDARVVCRLVTLAVFLCSRPHFYFKSYCHWKSVEAMKCFAIFSKLTVR